MRRLDLNPATRLLLWLVLLFAVQGLQHEWLGGACALSLFLGRRVVRRGMRLVWRARWVLASLAVFFAWGSAGEPLWSGYGAPTSEGLGLALIHLGRLYLVLIALAALLEAMPLTDLLSATHVLLKPLQWLGLEPARGVVRLMLVLNYVENLPRPSDWRSLLICTTKSTTECVEVKIHPLRWYDAVVLMFVLASCSWVLFGLNP